MRLHGVEQKMRGMRTRPDLWGRRQEPLRQPLLPQSTVYPRKSVCNGFNAGGLFYSVILVAARSQDGDRYPAWPSWLSTCRRRHLCPLDCSALLHFWQGGQSQIRAHVTLQEFNRDQIRGQKEVGSPCTL